MRRLRAIITGRVQGVNFRAFTRRQAIALGLTGWVRNRPDGAVEVMAEGEEARLLLLERMLREGPPMARVDAIELTWSDATGEFPDFHIQH